MQANKSTQAARPALRLVQGGVAAGTQGLGRESAHSLSQQDFDTLQKLGVRQSYPAGTALFSEGEVASTVYFIVTGEVTLAIDKFNSREEVSYLGKREFFGETAVCNQGRYATSAIVSADTELLQVALPNFIELVQSDTAIAKTIQRIAEGHYQALILKEKLIDVSGDACPHLHIGIKGDPSLRESAMLRERYVSVVDKILPELVQVFQELLFKRSAYQLFIAFNSGEVRVSSVLDPFGEEFHPAQRLLDKAYRDRHFPLIDFAQKMAIIKRQQHALRGDAFFAALPNHLAQAFAKYYTQWEPVPQDDIAGVISRLPLLREIQNYYVRNVTVSLIKDVIHMQFNCDGAHIVSTADFVKFIEQNL